ncbi:MAG: FkbM family methyltransferase, partial [Lentisphaerota bacterium]
VGVKHRDGICAQLAAAGEKNPIWHLCGYELCGSKIDFTYFRNHLSMFEAAYNNLSDDLSQKVFVNVLNAKLTGDFSLYEKIRSEDLYFDKELIELGEHEFFLDVGAYRGNAIVEFARRTRGKYDGIIAFEPDLKTSAILANTAKQNHINNLEIHNCGAWNRHAFLHFDDGREGSSRIYELTENASSSNSIEANTIDDVLHGRRTTYIAMDIEGAEHNAILGAEQSIKKWKPKMAVCVYHKREDLYDILLLLKSFVPDYKFYLRHYASNQTETVLYAI